MDAQRNLEHVLKAAREVFGELGYGAPMEDVARRARVGVGTVYRRFPSKEVLVRRIAEEETARLTAQAQAALGQEQEPWSALARFLRTSVASGAGRLLPPRILRAGAMGGSSGSAAGEKFLPKQRHQHGVLGKPELWLVENPPTATESVLPRAGTADTRQPDAAGIRDGSGAATGRSVWGALPKDTGVAAESGFEDLQDDPRAVELLEVVGLLVERAQKAGELRPDVTIGDVLLVIATAAPTLPDAAQQAAASARLLEILLEGLRSHPDA